MGRRRPICSSFFAVMLIVLTVSPFTAPFQIFDLSASAGEVPGHHDTSGDKISKECAITVIAAAGAPLLHSVFFGLNARELIAHHPLIPHTVLRL